MCKWLLISCFLVCLHPILSEEAIKAIIYESPSVDGLRMAEIEAPTMKENEALIKVAAAGINRIDILQRQGKYKAPKDESEILGVEVSGVVQSLGASSYCAFWQVGDRIMSLVPGAGYSEVVSVPCQLLMPAPTNIPLAHAAAIPEVWLTAYQLLVLVGNIAYDETVLLHAAASGVGTAAIQLIKGMNAHVIATASTSKLAYLTDELQADYAFPYKPDDTADDATFQRFSSRVKEVTGGTGVDIVLDCVGSSFWKQNLESLSVDGRWILFGLLGGADVDGDILRQLMRKRITLSASTLRSRSLDYKAGLVARFALEIVPLFELGMYRPVIDSVYPATQAPEAHQRMEDNLNTGKILLVFDETLEHLNIDDDYDDDGNNEDWDGEIIENGSFQLKEDL